MSEFSPSHARRLSTAEAAVYIGMSRSFLAHRRTTGGGPRRIKCGHRVVYDTRDLDAWLTANKS